MNWTLLIVRGRACGRMRNLKGQSGAITNFLTIDNLNRNIHSNTERKESPSLRILWFYPCYGHYHQFFRKPCLFSRIFQVLFYLKRTQQRRISQWSRLDGFILARVITIISSLSPVHFSLLFLSPLPQKRTWQPRRR